MRTGLVSQLVNLALTVACAGLFAFLGGLAVNAYFKRRNPALFERGAPLPPISAATVQMLRDHDSEMPTCAVDLKPAVREQPLYAQPARARAAIGTAPVAESRRS